MDKGELSTIDQAWSEAPPATAPSTSVSTHEAVPTPSSVPNAPPDTLDDHTVLSADEVLPEEPNTKTALSDTARTRVPARNDEPRDDVPSSLPRPIVTAKPPTAEAPSPPTPLPSPPTGTLPPPAGYDAIRQTARRQAYVLEKAATLPTVQLAETRVSSAHHPSAPTLDDSFNDYGASLRNELPSSVGSRRWTTSIAVVLVLIGVTAAGAAAVLAMRSPAPPRNVPASPTAASPRMVDVPPPAASASPSATSEPSDESGASTPSPSPAPVPTIALKSAQSSAAPVRVGLSAGTGAPLPAPTSPSAPPARSGAPSAVPPGLQFLKRNL